MSQSSTLPFSPDLSTSSESRLGGTLRSHADPLLLLGLAPSESTSPAAATLHLLIPSSKSVPNSSSASSSPPDPTSLVSSSWPLERSPLLYFCTATDCFHALRQIDAYYRFNYAHNRPTSESPSSPLLSPQSPPNHISGPPPAAARPTPTSRSYGEPSAHRVRPLGLHHLSSWFLR